MFALAALFVARGKRGPRRTGRCVRTRAAIRAETAFRTSAAFRPRATLVTIASRPIACGARRACTCRPVAIAGAITRRPSRTRTCRFVAIAGSVTPRPIASIARRTASAIRAAGCIAGRGTRSTRAARRFGLAAFDVGLRDTASACAAACAGRIVAPGAPLGGGLGLQRKGLLDGIVGQSSDLPGVQKGLTTARITAASSNRTGTSLNHR